jgi:hypothetical protein
MKMTSQLLLHKTNNASQQLKAEKDLQPKQKKRQSLTEEQKLIS